MSLFGDPMIAGHAGFARFPGLVRYVHPPMGGVVRNAPVLRQRGPDRWAPYNPAPYVPMPPPLSGQVSRYAGTNTQTRTKTRKKQYKRKCCRYIRGKKRCSPRFCSKRFYWY